MSAQNGMHKSRIKLEDDGKECHCVDIVQNGTVYTVAFHTCEGQHEHIEMIMNLPKEAILDMMQELHAFEHSKLIADIPSLAEA